MFPGGWGKAVGIFWSERGRRWAWFTQLCLLGPLNSCLMGDSGASFDIRALQGIHRFMREHSGAALKKPLNQFFQMLLHWGNKPLDPDGVLLLHV